MSGPLFVFFGSMSTSFPMKKARRSARVFFSRAVLRAVTAGGWSAWPADVRAGAVDMLKAKVLLDVVVVVDVC